MAIFQDNISFKTVEVSDILDVKSQFEAGGSKELNVGEILLQLCDGHVNIYTLSTDKQLVPVSLAEPDIKTEFLLRDNFDKETTFAVLDIEQQDQSNLVGVPFLCFNANATRENDNPWSIAGWPSFKFNVVSNISGHTFPIKKSNLASNLNLVGRSWCIDMYLKQTNSTRNNHYEIYSTDIDEAKGIQVYLNKQNEKLTVRINNVVYFSETGTHGNSKFSSVNWRHLALCREAGAEYRVYVDGDNIGSFADVEDTTSTDEYFYLGPAGKRSSIVGAYISAICQPRITVDTPLFYGSRIAPPGPYQ